MNAEYIELLIRPSLYRIDDISLNDDDDYLPSELPLTIKSMAPNGIYLINDGDSFSIWIGKNVDPHIIDTFFSYNNKKNIMSLLDVNDNEYIYKLHCILQYLQSVNYRHQTIKIILESERDKNEEFRTVFLIRDRTKSIMSYHEFLHFIHEQTILKKCDLSQY